MWKVYFFIVLTFCHFYSFSQEKFNTGECIREFMHVLASDSLKGRANYTPELFKSASYISSSFASDSLSMFPGADSYLLPFAPGKRLKDKWKDSTGNYDPRHVLYNVVGMIKGKTIPQEVVIFSSHYDHMGMTGKKLKGINIFNGANDNASGTAAMMAIARHYANSKTNERTLLFCAFAGEELGLLGSSVFSGYVNPHQIVAMINLEMIGLHNTGGPNSFFITGSEYSDLDEIIKNNLDSTGTIMLEEPNPEMKLFQRSDNLPFAMKGIPAHTIMSSNDAEECYHKTCDDVERIDFAHMKKIVSAILIATKPIIDGLETPSRITKRIEPL